MQEVNVWNKRGAFGCSKPCGAEHTRAGNFVLSAEWVGSVKPEIARAVLTAQREHLQSLVRKPLEVVVELDGPLSDAVKQKNFAVLRDLGFLS
jgi:hypothetical protein